MRANLFLLQYQVLKRQSLKTFLCDVAEKKLTKSSTLISTSYKQLKLPDLKTRNCNCSISISYKRYLHYPPRHCIQSKSSKPCFSNINFLSAPRQCQTTIYSFSTTTFFISTRVYICNSNGV